MTTQRLDSAMRSYHTMNQMVERYIRLSRSYVELSERFQKLDIEHMKIKGQMVPLLQQLKQYQQLQQILRQENQSLNQTMEATVLKHRQELQQTSQKYEEQLASLRGAMDALAPLQRLLDPAAQQELEEAEQQMGLVEDTLQEIESDSLPDLEPSDKALLAEYQANPAAFIGDQLDVPEAGISGAI